MTSLEGLAGHDGPAGFGPLDDYALGYVTGSSWAASRGTWDEIRSLVEWGRQTWFHLALRPEHSLAEFLSEEVWDCDPPAKRIRLPREPFVEGILAAVISAHDEARIASGAAHRREA